ncbi:GNAT family N-acetyltransferase [Hyphomonas sp.]|uniref:GNAT family N-acetyltransferase n=1 Tax=Hyphomonas sp. TaxID=87 RepID=UPI0035291F37
MTEGIPITRHPASPEQVERIRSAVRGAEMLNDSRLAQPEDAEGLHALFAEPKVNAPIYSLPRPLNVENVRKFIEEHLAQRMRGEGLLFVRDAGDGRIMGYSDIQVWPEWAAGEIAGGLHPSLHSKGSGTQGAAQTFTWMFDVLHLDLICETASLENVITQRMLDGMGFHRKGQVTSTRPDGSTRESLVWEMTRPEWAQHNA